MQRISAQNVVDLLLDAVCIVDANSQVVYVSPAFERIFGYTPEEAVGLKMFDLVHPADRQATEQQANRVMEGSLQLQFENRYIRKDGALVDILWTARWLPDRQLRLAVAHDITQRKRTESMHATMYAISAAAHTASSLPVLLERIHHILAAQINTVGFSVALTTPEGGFHRVYDARGTAPAPQALDAEAAEAAWYQQVLEQGAPLVQPLPAPESGGSEITPHYWLGVPLPSGDRPLGMLALRGRSTRESPVEAAQALLEFVARPGRDGDRTHSTA